MGVQGHAGRRAIVPRARIHSYADGKGIRAAAETSVPIGSFCEVKCLELDGPGCVGNAMLYLVGLKNLGFQ